MSAFPQLRFVSLVENGTQMGAYRTGETTLAKSVLPALRAGMLCLADRQFFGFECWRQALGCDKRLADGSYLSTLYPSAKDRRHHTNGIRVRVIEYRLQGVVGAEPIYRLATSILDPKQAPAGELAPLYHERWEIETALDELKTHLRGARSSCAARRPIWSDKSSTA